MFFLSSFLVYSPIVASLGVMAFSQTRYYRTPRELPPLTLACLGGWPMAVVALWLCGYAAQPQRHSHFGFAVAWIGYATAIALTRSSCVSRRSVVFACVTP